MSPAAVLCGLGGWTPPELVTNDALAAVLDTSDEWIRTRTGIRRRYVVPAGMSTGRLAVEAGRRALDSAGVDAVDALVLATSTPDRPCPATAPSVAAELGMSGIAAFDLAAVCTGFVYALATAGGLISGGIAGSVLVIGADTFSTILDPADRTTRVIFGDGAGAAVLRAGEAGEPGALLGVDLGSEGEGKELITVPAGGSEQRSARTTPAETDHYFQMQGKPVFARAVRRMSESARRAAAGAGWAVADIGALVAHQANARILRACAAELGIAPERAVCNVDRVGNTVAASVPLALADAAAGGDIAPGDRLVLTGFGGGLTWGAAALHWPDIPVHNDPNALRAHN